MEYQNFYIILCCLIIYSCCKISLMGFVSIISLTYVLIMLEEQDRIINLSEVFDETFMKTPVVSAKAVDENRVTKNPRKKINDDVYVPSPSSEEESKVIKDVEMRSIDEKPSPYQQSYQQRKRYLESVYKDLEQDNKWKKDDITCRPVRSDSSFVV